MTFRCESWQSTAHRQCTRTDWHLSSKLNQSHSDGGNVAELLLLLPPMAYFRWLLGHGRTSALMCVRFCCPAAACVPCSGRVGQDYESRTLMTCAHSACDSRGLVRGCHTAVPRCQWTLGVGASSFTSRLEPGGPLVNDNIGRRSTNRGYARIPHLPPRAGRFQVVMYGLGPAMLQPTPQALNF